jgi:APA family basic amino acid/polyamine antiporter
VSGAPAGGELARRLGTFDAVMIGLGSMVGAGVFAAFTPAAQAAGGGLLVGLAIAALVAFCNATSSAQLAAQYPTSGGTYVYGRQRLGEWYGFLAGWGFVIGKTASCAAMALTFASYAAPDGWARPVAVAAVLALAAVNYRGVTRTARLAKIIVTVVLAALAVVVAAGLAGGQAQADRLGGWDDVIGGDVIGGGAYGILQSAGLLFFAFAGYARIATMGEEVRDPGRTIPRAIGAALGIALVVYAVVAVSILSVLGADGVAATAAPLAAAVDAGTWSWAGPVVRLSGAAACLGALLALLAGIGRTSLAMARNGDLPRWLAAVHPRYRVPHHAEATLAVVVSAFVLVADLRGAIGFSSFGVLLYYLVANLAAWTQIGRDRRYPKALQVIGALGCAVLVATLPVASILGGLAVYLLGVLYRLYRLASARKKTTGLEENDRITGQDGRGAKGDRR